jgi:SAM-dependent methyltransferase
VTRGPDHTIARPDVRAGYDLWAPTYDVTPNPVVALDTRVTPALLRSLSGERVLDAGCGTGRAFPTLLTAGARVTGVDFALGMLRVAQRHYPGVSLTQADVQGRLPFRGGVFDAALCALVGEHLDQLPAAARELRRVLRRGGRLIFSVYHPAMAAAGKEANFQRDGVEYRLGAVRHTLSDYIAALAAAGFTELRTREHLGDAALAEQEPAARKFLNFPLLLVLEARAG